MLSVAGKCLKNQCLDSYDSPLATGRLCLRRAAPAFEILMLAPVRRFFPEPRQRLNGGWHRSRVLHPSEDLSELPPLRSVVAGQVYHYRLAGSSQNSLPRLLPAGWGRSSPYWAVFIQQSCTGGLRASAKSLSLIGFCQLMYC